MKEPQYPYVKVSIALDTSYTRTGMAVSYKSEIENIRSIGFKGKRSWTEKRLAVADALRKWIIKYKPDVIIVERTRQFSAGFMSINAMKAQITMTAVVVDTAFGFNIPVYSVDTRSWKAQIVGTSKPKNGDKKLPTKEFVEALGWDIGKNDDAADAACMSLYAFLPEDQRKLKLEK